MPTDGMPAEMPVEENAGGGMPVECRLFNTPRDTMVFSKCRFNSFAKFSLFSFH